ncbi:MAG: DUF5721 family protein [Clostridium sp.]
MVALKIAELKEFTKRLFVGEVFDTFLVREANITTFNSITIDGKIRHGYYSDEELELGKIERFSSWKVLRPFCFSLIKGSKLPESFFIVLQLPPSGVEHFLADKNIKFLPELVNGLYMNIRYDDQILTCITGTSVDQFTLDKTLDREWDEAVKNFLKKHEIAFEEQ